MGLDLSVGNESCGSWSYSGFNDFRRKLAEQVGIVLGNMEGFHNFNYRDFTRFSDYMDAIKLDSLAPKISWETVDDPIKHLLSHSDCDGELDSSICGELADRLEEIIMNWPTKRTLNLSDFWQANSYPAKMELDDYDTTQARRLVEGLRKAAELNIPVEFH